MFIVHVHCSENRVQYSGNHADCSGNHSGNSADCSGRHSGIHLLLLLTPIHAYHQYKSSATYVLSYKEMLPVPLVGSH